MDLNETACEETQKAFDSDYPGQSNFVLCDVTSRDQLEGWCLTMLLKSFRYKVQPLSQGLPSSRSPAPGKRKKRDPGNEVVESFLNVRDLFSHHAVFLICRIVESFRSEKENEDEYEFACIVRMRSCP